jgi:hypothetical protein
VCHHHHFTEFVNLSTTWIRSAGTSAPQSTRSVFPDSSCHPRPRVGGNKVPELGYIYRWSTEDLSYVRSQTLHYVHLATSRTLLERLWGRDGPFNRLIAMKLDVTARSSVGPVQKARTSLMVMS